MGLLKDLSDEISEIIDHICISIVQIRRWDFRSRLNPLQFFTNSDTNGIGAGVIVHSDGLILTNCHVVQKAQRLCVTTNDGRSFEPEIIGLDPISDVAVLHIPTIDLTPAPIRENRPARLGEIVVAIGHPFGLVSSISMGIVSAAARFGLAPSGKLPQSFIQTDSTLNPGNSGGALVGCDGLVIGINTWGINADKSNGIAFAIPIATALNVAGKMLENQNLEYATIGIGGSEFDLPAEAVSKHGIAQTTGILVQEVIKNGSAQRAGILPGDWIIAINGNPMKNLPDFMELLNEKMIGQTISLIILRGLDYAIAEKKVLVEKMEVAE